MFEEMHARTVPSEIGSPDVSPTDLRRIMGDHKRYLSGCPGTRAKLRSAKLDGMMLAHMDLAEADLSGASLVGANLSGANLARASLNCADLRGCNLKGAHLEHADLRGVTFNGANLSYANLDFADLRAESMMYVGDRPKFQGNAHDEAPFGAVDFSNASLRNTSFRNARLDNANFTDALLEGAMFRGARLGNPCFRGAVLTDVDLGELDVPPKALRLSLKAPTPAARARAGKLLETLRAHHEWFVSSGKRGRPANIDDEDLRPLDDSVKGLCLAGLSARRVVAVSVDFSGCQFQAAKFDGADLRAASFAGADLSGCSIQHVKLAHASFHKARMQDLTLCTGQVLHFQVDTPRTPPREIRSAA